jgi:hypothetical protein
LKPNISWKTFLIANFMNLAEFDPEKASDERVAEGSGSDDPSEQ